MYIALNIFLLIIQPPTRSTLFPYTTLFRSRQHVHAVRVELLEIGGQEFRVVHADPPEVWTAVSIAVCAARDRKSTRLNSSHVEISYAVFCLKKKKIYSTVAVEYSTLHQRAL